MKYFLSFLSLLFSLSVGAEITVTNTEDSGVGSLRQAISVATPGETIVFDSSLSGQSIAVGNVLSIDKSLTIDASALPSGLTLASTPSTPGSDSVLRIHYAGGALPSANIIFVTGSEEEVGVDPPDIGYTNLLSEAGHQVTRWLTRDDPTPDDAVFMNAADLIILGRTVSSNDFRQSQETEFWNTQVTTPIINMSGFVLRRSRIGWYDSSTTETADADVALEPTVDRHPIFEGVVWDDDDLGDDTRVLAPYATLLSGQRGITFNVAEPFAGKVLARAANVRGANGLSVAGYPAISEFRTGDIVDAIESPQALAGPRISFLTGSREADGAPSNTAGQYDLTPLGEAILLNAVRYLSDPATVTLKGLTIVGGGQALQGGGIDNLGAHLTIESCVLRNNSGNDGGGIHSFGSLTIKDSMIEGNTAPGSGGGLYNQGVLTLSRTTLRGNNGSLGGGLFNGRLGSLDANQCTLSGNSADCGGGLWTFGDGSLANSTVYGNTAMENGGGIDQRAGSLSLDSATVAENEADREGGGISVGTLGALSLSNTIVADNTIPGDRSGPDVYQTVTLQGAGVVSAVGVNLLSDLADSSLVAGPTVLVGAPQLGSLGDFGGGMATVPLLAGSPAIDAAGATSLATDQRGASRSLGAGPDIGAYESGNGGYAEWILAAIPDGVLAGFTDDADRDGTSNGVEYAVGLNASVPDADAEELPVAVLDSAGRRRITFSFSVGAFADTAWILRRSTDLVNYEEIYRFDGPTGSTSSVEGVFGTGQGNSILVSDDSEYGVRVFYELVAELTSP